MNSKSHRKKRTNPIKLLTVKGKKLKNNSKWYGGDELAHVTKSKYLGFVLTSGIAESRNSSVTRNLTLCL